MLQNSPCTLAAAASSATRCSSAALSPGAPILTQSVTQDAPNSALSWLLSSLVPGSAPQARGDRLPLGPGLPTVPKALMEKIQRWEFIDLAELLPSCNIHEASASQQVARFSLFTGCEFVRPKRKQIEDILDWVQAFTIYTAAIVQKHPETIAELLSYQLTIIKAAQQYDGLQ